MVAAGDLHLGAHVCVCCCGGGRRQGDALVAVSGVRLSLSTPTQVCAPTSVWVSVCGVMLLASPASVCCGIAGLDPWRRPFTAGFAPACTPTLPNCAVARPAAPLCLGARVCRACECL